MREWTTYYSILLLCTSVIVSREAFNIDHSIGRYVLLMEIGIRDRDKWFYVTNSKHETIEHLFGIVTCRESASDMIGQNLFNVKPTKSLDQIIRV